MSSNTPQTASPPGNINTNIANRLQSINKNRPGSFNQNGNPPPPPAPGFMDRVSDIINNTTDYIKSFGSNNTSERASINAGAAARTSTSSGNANASSASARKSSNTGNTNSAGTNKAKQVPSGVDNLDQRVNTIIADNYYLIMGLFIAFMLLILLYFFSKSFNVSRTISKMKVYDMYQKINNYDMKQEGAITLNNVFVASSFNSCNMGAQMFSYTSEDILKQVLRCGARYIEFNVFSDKYGQNGIPVIDSGYKRGEWKLMLNTTTFESAIITLAQNAFKVLEKDGGAPNPTDPIFLALNLSTGHNIACLDKLADILVDYFSDKLLGPKYAYQFTNDIQNIKMSDLESKVVIFASPGFEGSKLEELVNSSWIDETDINQARNNITLLSTPNTSSTNNDTGSNAESFANPTTAKSDEPVDDFVKLEEVLKKPPADKSRKSNNKAVRSHELNSIQAQESLEKLEDALKREFGADLVRKVKKQVNSKDNNGSKKEQAGYAKPGDAKENYNDIPPSLDMPAIISSQQPKIIRISSSVLSSPGFDESRIRMHNKSGITIVVPHVEGDYLTRNFDPALAWELGCQFVAMNYQEIDEHIDKYITHFETAGITSNKID